MKIDAGLVEGFVGSTLSKGFQGRVKSPKCHREWWELCCSNRRYVALAAPRNHAKSTAITHAYLLAAVLWRDREFAIIVSDTEGQAILFLNDIKKELTENENIITLFGIKKLKKDAETDIIMQMNDGHEFRIMAKGSEQKVRGLKWKGKRPDLIIGDDLENDEIVMNPDRREKFKRWMYGALLPALSDNGVIRLVGTILHMDSFLNRLMPSDFSKDTIHEELKVYSTNEKILWKSVKYRAHNPDMSQILWKQRFSKEFFREKQREYTGKGISDVYNQEYLNNPIDETRSYFKKGDLLEMTEAEKDAIIQEKKYLNYYVGADLAISEKEKSDYTVFIVGGLDERGILYILEVIRDRLDSRDIIDLIMEIQQKYKPDLFCIEKEKITKAIGPFLREEMIKRQIFPIIEELVPSNDKEERARSIQGRLRIHGIRFDKEADWFPVLEQELTQFPRSVKNDQVDAFAYLGLALDKFVDAPTKEEKNESDYDEEFRLYQDDSEWGGRSLVTGY